MVHHKQEQRRDQQEEPRRKRSSGNPSPELDMYNLDAVLLWMQGDTSTEPPVARKANSGLGAGPARTSLVNCPHSHTCCMESGTLQYGHSSRMAGMLAVGCIRRIHRTSVTRQAFASGKSPEALDSLVRLSSFIVIYAGKWVIW
jgi:predicted dehydrogenase